ncbi:MAG: PASTA domain-containing protein [Acidimicrobiia bacterium]|nr:PASTA domain-containing protein [Acidimicrobiia bacterium]
MPGERAADLLGDAGYVVALEERGDVEFPPGTVLAQRPEAHAPVTPGAEVTLVVAREPRSLTVPLLLGMTAEDAETTAHFVGLDIRIVVEAEPPPGAAERDGRVWRQSIVSGTRVDESSEITVWTNP